MANVDTVMAITDNLEALLKGLKIAVERVYTEELRDIPASKLPIAQIFYQAEDFEYTHGQKPEYAEIEFLIRVLLSRDKGSIANMRNNQKKAHEIRDGVTINTLNIGDLASSKLVSRVTSESVRNRREDDMDIMDYTLKIRYREL
jgi:hypothetical protein